MKNHNENSGWSDRKEFEKLKNKTKELAQNIQRLKSEILFETKAFITRKTLLKRVNRIKVGKKIHILMS